MPSGRAAVGLGSDASGIGSAFTTIETDRPFAAAPVAAVVRRGRASGAGEPVVPLGIDADFFVEGAACDGIVGVVTGVPVAGVDAAEADFLGVWLVLTDLVEADTATCLTVTLVLLAAGLEVLADAEGFDEGAFADDDDFAVVFVIVADLEAEAAAGFVATVEVLDDKALVVVAFFLAGALRRSGTSSSSSSLLSLSLTSSSLVDSSRFRLALVFAPFAAPLPLGIVVAGKSQCPRSSDLIFLLMKASRVFVTFGFARMSTCTLRTSARIAQIAFESCIRDIVALYLWMRSPMSVNSIGDTFVGFENGMLYCLSRTMFTQIVNVSMISLSNLTGRAVTDVSHLSSVDTPGNVSVCCSIRYTIEVRHWKSRPRPFAQSRSLPNPWSPSIFCWICLTSVGRIPVRACSRSMQEIHHRSRASIGETYLLA